jgi:3-hydroxyacyl-CoA dehydrogenase/3-hydroxy-2-methylbutyryl-CoA dehydrogenase
MLKVSLVGTFSVMTHSVSAMLRNDPDDDGERGVVITTSSDAAYDGSRGQAAYSASKAGIIAQRTPTSTQPRSGSTPATGSSSEHTAAVSRHATRGGAG